MKYTPSGQELESLNNPGQGTSMLGMLTYPDDFSKSSGLSQLWYKDTGTATALATNPGLAGRQCYIIRSPNPKGTFSISVPLIFLALLLIMIRLFMDSNR